MELPAGVTLEKLVAMYEKRQTKLEKRKEFYMTEQGKAYNRAKAKEYYDAHKEEIAVKSKARYEANPEKYRALALKYASKKKEVSEA